MVGWYDNEWGYSNRLADLTLLRRRQLSEAADAHRRRSDPSWGRGRRVLVRCDLNVPLAYDADRARVTDDGRIRASLPVLTRLLDHGARVIVAAHLGRPKGEPDPRYSLRPVADRLAPLLGRPVEFALDTVGESARLLAADLEDGELLLLENVRFNPGETSKDTAGAAAFRPGAGSADRRRGRRRRLRGRRLRCGASQARLGLRRGRAAAALLRRPGPRRARGAAAADRRVRSGPTWWCSAAAR